ncbi:hypothetical protein [Phytohalomonas tamaricis]|uniref:hypothetical protein n=1 Tax=Phytohalomonas tamaricis TaxID=2081032 RepID=UPI00131A2C45|nr:hypothetical protein [Phytohalomonas tamaricis]
MHVTIAIDISTPKKQGGFSLLIGLILLTGMSILALSLFSSGLFETRSAYQTGQRVENFQLNDGVVDQLLMDLLPDSSGETSSLMTQLQQLEKDQSIDITVCADDEDDCSGEGSITLKRVDNPCDDEALIRELSSSNGRALCRYYEADISREQQRDILHSSSALQQGLFDVTYSATTSNGLAL